MIYIFSFILNYKTIHNNTFDNHVMDSIHVVSIYIYTYLLSLYISLYQYIEHITIKSTALLLYTYNIYNNIYTIIYLNEQ